MLPEKKDENDSKRHILALQVATKYVFLIDEISLGKAKYMKQLADSLGKSTSRITKDVQKLKAHNLVSVENAGGKKKACKLTEEGLYYYEMLKKLPGTKPVHTATKENLAMIIRTLKEGGLPPGIKQTAADKLGLICGEAIIEDKGSLRDYFVDVIEHLDIYEKDELAPVLLALNHYLRCQITVDDDLEWLREQALPKLLSLIKEDRSIKAKEIALIVLYELDRRCRKERGMAELANNVESQAEKMFFDPEEERGVANRCWDILWQHGDQTSSAKRQRLIDRLFKGAKSEDDKLRDRCLEYLKSVLEEDGAWREAQGESGSQGKVGK